MDMDKLRSKIKSFTLSPGENGRQGFSRVLIQLFGLLGHGKSSFINSCLYVWEDGDYKNWAESAASNEGCTMNRLAYPLTSHLTLVDNRGYAKLGSYESGEIFAQLDAGYHPDNDQADFFIHSVKTGVHPTEADEIKHLLHTAAKLTGIYPIVVLTYKTSGSLTDTIAAFRDMGAEKIFAFENYTLEDCDKTRGRHEEVLKFLSEVIEEAIFQIDHSRDPEREMKERKQFVLNYVHEREKKLQEDKVERHKVQEKAIKVTQLRKEEETMEKLRKREEMEMEEEVRRKQEEMERMNLVDQARREAEIRAQRASKDKKKKWYGRLFH
ncbi:unnamed protein product [Ranitomeya imitator]|uniref:G domain-containing protein n=1 Tax=Ranitomeya imitator TaxID=111125 RepID=A0ABN9LSB8_9NEOB|nr:unnamed protein product [Ranitomeya imitator]